MSAHSPSLSSTSHLSLSVTSWSATTSGSFQPSCDAAMAFSAFIHIIPDLRGNVTPQALAAWGSPGPIAFDDLSAALSLLLLLNFSSGTDNQQWLASPLIQMESVPLTEITLNKTSHVRTSMLLRPVAGWPGLLAAPYSSQRLSLLVTLFCANSNGTTVARPIEIDIVVEPRAPLVAASVRSVVSRSATITGVVGAAAAIVAFSLCLCDTVVDSDGNCGCIARLTNS